VNVGPALPTDGAPGTQLGVFRDLCNDPTASPLIVAATPVTMTNLAAPSRRPMISDNPYRAVRNGNAWAVAGRVWTGVDLSGATPLNVTANQMGFVWPGVGLARDFGPVDFAAGQSPLGTSAYPTNHSGIAVVTFCDGHGEKFTDSALCNEFDCMPIIQ
jgi:hypothetical protein